jgi:tRNA-specific 2-thiouridylase
VWDLSERFEDTVVADFLSEYEAGRTPNPCVRCNEHIKFEALLDKATALGFDAVATGHYAQIVTREVGRRAVRELHRSPNDAKDQSYVLAVAGPERLARAMFPLGGFASKDEVRAEAARRGLSVSAKPDSYDICFVADGDTRGFLRSRLGSRPGSVVDVSGEVVGEHDGAYAFTVGQRRGLALGRPAADGRARYVVDVQPATNTVVVGPAELLSVDRIAGEEALWFDGVLPTPLAGTAPSVEPVEPVEPVETPDVVLDPDGWFDAEVQVRAHGAPVPARVRSVARADDAYGDDVPEGERPASAADGSDQPAPAMEIELTGAPLRGVAPGQSVVVYRGTRVLGQATVSRAWRAPAPR